MNKQTCTHKNYTEQNGAKVCLDCDTLISDFSSQKTCTCVELLGNKKDWHLASHAANCPLYKGFNKEEFERQAEEVQKTFQEPEQDWEKKIRSDYKGIISDEQIEATVAYWRYFIHSHDKAVREEAYKKGFEDGSQYKVLEAGEEDHPDQDWEKEWERLTSDHEFDYVNDGKAFIWVVRREAQAECEAFFAVKERMIRKQERERMRQALLNSELMEDEVEEIMKLLRDNKLEE